MNIGKKGLVLLSAGGLLIGGLGFVGAQTQSGGNSGTITSDAVTSDATTSDAAAQSESGQDGSLQRRYGLGRGFGSGFGRGHERGHGRGGVGGLPFGRVALGTTMTLSFYDTDPGASGGAGTPTQTLNFVYGQDSEAAFAQSFAEARANASYMTAEVGEQTQTLELPSTDTSTSGTSNSNDGDRHGGIYGLGEGSSVTATFYDGDPTGNAQTLQTLNFTYGQDSEAGFANDFADAAEEAACVTITTSPRTYTVDLSAAAENRDSRQHNQHRGGHRR